MNNMSAIGFPKVSAVAWQKFLESYHLEDSSGVYLSLPDFLGMQFTAPAPAPAPTINLLSSNLSYTMNPNPSMSYPDDGLELTNGLTTEHPEGWTIGWLNVNPVITFNLQTQHAYTSARIHASMQLRAGVSAPESISVEVSNDGVSWTTSKILTNISDTTGWIDMNNLTAIGQYIRFVVIRKNQWVMLNEIEFYGYTV